jgi:hypothetical protein
LAGYCGAPQLHKLGIGLGGAIWVAWPKRAPGIDTDLTENVICDHALQTPLVDVKVFAIDETWSGLKLVIRKKHRLTHARANAKD